MNAFLFVFPGHKSVPVWIVTVASLCVIVISIISMINTSEIGYKIYPNGMTLEEIETEYDIVNIKGLILMAYKKE